MDEKFKQSLGITSTASAIGIQKVCDVRDLPDFGGTLVSGTGKNFTQLPAVCLLIDILGFGTLMEHKNPVNVAFESDAFFKSCLDSCMKGYLGGAPPDYALIGSNCQDYVNVVVNKCKAQCGGK